MEMWWKVMFLWGSFWELNTAVHSRITSAKRFLPEFDYLAALPFCNLSFFINQMSTDYILRWVWHQFTVSSQGNLQHEYAGSDSVLLDGPQVRQELISLLGYLKLCMYFSKKPYNVFLEFGGYDQNNVLIKKSKARVRKYQSSLYCQLCIDFFKKKMYWDLTSHRANNLLFIPVLN